MLCDLIKETVMVRNIHHGVGKGDENEDLFPALFLFQWRFFGFFFNHFGEFWNAPERTHCCMMVIHGVFSGCSKLNETKVKGTKAYRDGED